MNKHNLVTTLAKRYRLPPDKIDLILTDFLAEVAKAVAADGACVLHRFGAFTAHPPALRRITLLSGPAQGTVKDCRTTKRITFKAYKEFKQLVNPQPEVSPCAPPTPNSSTNTCENSPSSSPPGPTPSEPTSPA